MSQRGNPLVLDMPGAGVPANGNGAPDQSAIQPVLDILAEIRLELGKANRREDGKARERVMLNQYIYPIVIPAGSAAASASGALVIANPELFGPRTGVYWDVTRINVAGLASTSEAVTIYKGSTGSSSDFQRVNTVTQITAQSSAALYGTFVPRTGACLLRAGESLSVQGTGLTANEVITVSWDAISIAAEWLGAYLL